MSKTREWSTPSWLFEALNAEFGFTLDPCASSTNAKCSRYFTVKEDGLAQEWGQSIVFMNPPYGSAISAWMRKAYESSQGGATVVCLVPARTDTKWWHRYAMKGEIRLLRGRIKFGEGRASAPFPSALVVFRPRAPHGQPHLLEEDFDPIKKSKGISKAHSRDFVPLEKCPVEVLEAVLGILIAQKANREKTNHT